MNIFQRLWYSIFPPKTLPAKSPVAPAETQLQATPAITIAPLAKAPVSKQPRGIYSLAQQNAPLFPDSILQAPYVSGLAIRGSWDALETTSGVYDFSIADTWIAAAQLNGKKASISVAAGMFTPSWLKAKMVSPQILTLAGQTVPIPWSLLYQTYWARFLNALGAKYDANPTVSYITMSGFGNGVEPFLIASDDDYATFIAGGGWDAWATGAKAMIDFYASAFRQTPFFFPLAELVDGCTTAEYLAGQAAMLEVIAYGEKTYPGRFNLCQHGLGATNQTGLDANWRNQEIVEFAPMAGYQLVGPVGSPYLGNLQTALNNGIVMKADFIEVYAQDVTANASILTVANNTLTK